MIKSATISIIVPCYNQAQYLDECLQSVLNQTYTNWECIIVNDGSPDNTEEIALKWTEKDLRFKYLKKINGGLSSARNAGIKIAKGQWILPLDCDDKIGDKYLELAEKEFDKGYKLIYSRAILFNETSSREWQLFPYNYKNILMSNHIYCSAFYQKTDWEKVDGYDENLIYGREDWEFWIAILNESSKVKKLDYVGFYYRRKEHSMDIELNTNNEKRIYSENYIFKKHIEKYLDLDKNIMDSYKKIIFESNKYQYLLKEINKNILTRGLYKIIEKLN